MGKIFSTCGKCGTETDAASLQPVSMNEDGYSRHLNVCQRCYSVCLNESYKNEKLLNG